MIPSFRTLPRSREPSSSPRKIPIQSLFSEKKSRSAGSSSRPPKRKKRKQERSSRVSRMRLLSFTRLSKTAVVFLSVKTTRSPSWSIS